MKTQFIFALSILFFGCNSKPTEIQNDSLKGPSLEYLEQLDELSPAQEAALDAFTTLQTSSDERNRIYCTFPDIHQPFYPPDTTFFINQSEFLEVMKTYISQNHTSYSKERQIEMAEITAQAQEEYRVHYCSNQSFKINFSERPPLKDTWVLAGVQRRIDVVLKW